MDWHGTSVGRDGLGDWQLVVFVVLDHHLHILEIFGAADSLTESTGLP